MPWVARKGRDKGAQSTSSSTQLAIAVATGHQSCREKHSASNEACPTTSDRGDIAIRTTRQTVRHTTRQIQHARYQAGHQARHQASPTTTCRCAHPGSGPSRVWQVTGHHRPTCLHSDDVALGGWGGVGVCKGPSPCSPTDTAVLGQTHLPHTMDVMYTP
jgi:hypothetical protein